MSEPKYAPIPGWCAISGMSRTATYDALVHGHLKAIKAGRRTLIAVEPGLAWLQSLPQATFRLRGTFTMPVARAAVADPAGSDE
jgi:hypothetical protein